MKLFFKLGITCTLLIVAASCEQDELPESQSADGFRIKSTISNGRLNSVYKYNQQGDIAEWEDLYFYDRYIYDDEERLIRRESAVDPMTLAAVATEKTILMTSDNATISSYQTFDYNSEGQLAEVGTYVEKEGVFALRSMRTFEHQGGYIVRENLHDENGEITQFRIYEYDSRGNVQKEVYYSLLLTQEPELINEVTFSYDNKRNPFTIFKALGTPGLFTNTNNIMEASTTYLYNQYNYPVKVVHGNSEVEYKY